MVTTLKAPFDLSEIQPVQQSELFNCPTCHDAAYRATNRIANVLTGQITCTSCLLNQVFDGHGKIVGRYSAVIDESNTANLHPGKWTMTSRCMRLA